MSKINTPLKVGQTYKDGYGRDVRIVSDEGMEPLVLVGLVKINAHDEEPCLFTSDGRYGRYGTTQRDLIPPKPETVRVRGWLNVYPNGAVYLHSSKEDAERSQAGNCIDCIEIDHEVTVGEGLEDE